MPRSDTAAKQTPRGETSSIFSRLIYAAEWESVLTMTFCVGVWLAVSVSVSLLSSFRESVKYSVRQCVRLCL